ncbi:hypothetical protein D3C73_932440 [compost metagenome]
MASAHGKPQPHPGPPFFALRQRDDGLTDQTLLMKQACGRIHRKISQCRQGFAGQVALLEKRCVVHASGDQIMQRDAEQLPKRRLQPLLPPQRPATPLNGLDKGVMGKVGTARRRSPRHQSCSEQRIQDVAFHRGVQTCGQHTEQTGIDKGLLTMTLHVSP